MTWGSLILNDNILDFQGDSEINILCNSYLSSPVYDMRWDRQIAAGTLVRFVSRKKIILTFFTLENLLVPLEGLDLRAHIRYGSYLQHPMIKFQILKFNFNTSES